MARLTKQPRLIRCQIKNDPVCCCLPSFKYLLKNMPFKKSKKINCIICKENSNLKS